MHLPPVAAVALVNQLTISPASSLWNVCVFFCSGSAAATITKKLIGYFIVKSDGTYDGCCRMSMVIRLKLRGIISDDVD